MMRSLNLPNFLSLLRLALIPVFAYLFYHGETRASILVFVFAGITDVVDGFLARHYNQKTQLGAYLDPAADKLLMMTAFILLSLRQVIPWWVTLVVIIRDVYLVSGIAVLKILKRPLWIESNFWGKKSTLFQLVTACLGLILALMIKEPQAAGIIDSSYLKIIFPYALYTVCLFAVISALGYTRVGINALRKQAM